MAQTPVAHLYVTDTPTKRALNKELVGGGHASRGVHARALRHVVPAVATAARWPRELGRAGGTGEELPAAGRSARQGGAAAEAGVAVTAKSCACRRAVRYTVVQQRNITRCFLSLKLLWAYFWFKKKKQPTELDVLGRLPLSLKTPRLFKLKC